MRELCETFDDVKRLSGLQADVIGMYRQVDVRMRQKPPPVYAGHAVVTLDDGTDVRLEPTWSEQAVRPDEERRQFDGRRVIVTGTVHERSPAPSEPVAHILGPCVSPVEAVRPA